MAARERYGGAVQAGKVAPLPAGNEAIVRKSAGPRRPQATFAK
jgi:hypothetical protein